MTTKFKIPENLPETLKLPWGDPPKPNVWKAKIEEEHVSHSALVTEYKVSSPLLKSDLWLIFLTKNSHSPTFSAGMSEIRLYNVPWDKVYGKSSKVAGLEIPNYFHSPANLENYLSAFWSMHRDKIKTFLKDPNKIASNLKVMAFPQEAPERINIPWGDPPKPNAFVAVMQNRTAPKEILVTYDVKSPLIDVDDDTVHLTYQKLLSKYPTLIMRLSYEKNGKFYNHERTLPDCTLTEPQLLGYLKMFWENNREVLKETLIRKDMRVASDLSQYQIDPLFSNVRTQEVQDMKVASSGTAIMWGDPPKPNLWKVEKQPWKPNTGGGDFYLITSPLMEGGLLANFHRIQGIRRDDMFVNIRFGASYTDKVVVGIEIDNGVPHLARTDQNYGAWLTELWQRRPVLQTLVKSRLKSNFKIASNLSQYQIDPRFVKPAPKKMTRTAGEVRFVKDNSNDASSWAWGDTGASERRIPADFVFKKNAQKALAKTMRSSLSSMGHALSAYHTFTKIKSADVSPDGALGGRGYIQKVAHMRRAFMNVAEALSALSDTIYDEINAPHWNDAGTPKEVKEIIEEAEEIREDPEAWAEEQESSNDDSKS